MKLTKKWLEEKHACQSAMEWWKENHKPSDPVDIINNFIKSKEHLDWANWLIVRIMPNKINKVKYAVYAAKQVIKIYEENYPNDKRLRNAIIAAEKYIKNPTDKNKSANAANAANAAANAANAAAYAANAAANAAYAANAAANAANAANAAAYAAANAAYAAAYAANAAAYAANAAYAAAADADATDAKIKMQIKILKYGLKLLGET